MNIFLGNFDYVEYLYSKLKLIVYKFKCNIVLNKFNIDSLDSILQYALLVFFIFQFFIKWIYIFVHFFLHGINKT